VGDLIWLNMFISLEFESLIRVKHKTCIT